MNPAPSIKAAADRPEVGVDTARLLLQHALDAEAETETDEESELARKQAVSDLTGTSIHVPADVLAEEPSALTTKRLVVTRPKP